MYNPRHPERNRMEGPGKGMERVKLLEHTPKPCVAPEGRWNISFIVPTSPLLIPPLQISDAASGAKLTAFREVMNYRKLMRSFSQSAQYEAAGIVWMLDPLTPSRSDVMSISQLESAMWTWSGCAYLLSSPTPSARRFSFHVLLPVKVEDRSVA